MLYYLFDYLDRRFDLLGAGVFQYISFRAGMAVIISLLIAAIYGKKIIALLHRLQVGESIRDLGLEGQMKKKGTPTMGGLIMISAILVPTLLFAKINNIYIILLVISTIWLGMIGFLDDYIKVFLKNKEGLHGRFKVVGQVGLGIIAGHFDFRTRRALACRSTGVVKRPSVAGRIAQVGPVIPVAFVAITCRAVN